MELDYNSLDDVLHLGPEGQVEDGCALLDNPGIVLLTGTDGGCDIVGAVIMAASYHMSLRHGYDAKSDTLLLGKDTDDSALITKNGDFVGYWKLDEDDLNGLWEPTGVAIKQASEHLAPVLEILPKRS